jgi:hypothetical protein
MTSNMVLKEYQGEAPHKSLPHFFEKKKGMRKMNLRTL